MTTASGEESWDYEHRFLRCRHSSPFNLNYDFIVCKVVFSWEKNHKSSWNMVVPCSSFSSNCLLHIQEKKIALAFVIDIFLCLTFPHLQCLPSPVILYVILDFVCVSLCLAQVSTSLKNKSLILDGLRLQSSSKCWFCCPLNIPMRRQYWLTHDVIGEHHTSFCAGGTYCSSPEPPSWVMDLRRLSLMGYPAESDAAQWETLL